MPLAKPLVPEEVPEEYKSLVHFDGQFQQSYAYSGRTKMRSMVWVTCPVCTEDNSVPVNDVRNYVKGVRSQFPGTHRKCKYPGKYVNGDGYHFRLMPDHPNAMGGKYVAEHIYAMSEHLGRKIDTKVESVHHIDGDKSNNDISNLQLRKAFHGKGQAWECNSCGSHDIKAVQL